LKDTILKFAALHRIPVNRSEFMGNYIIYKEPECHQPRWLFRAQR